MNPFTFQAKTRVVYGAGAVQKVANEAAPFAADTVFIVTDPGVVAAGLLQPLTAALEAGNIDYTVFAEVESNPTGETIAAGAEQLRGTEAGLVIGLGGGSPMDAAKAIAVMAANEGEVADYAGKGVDPWPVAPLPLIAIPTTAGTGAEVSGAAMLNLPEVGRKVDIFGYSILPAVAILDPELTVGLPPHLTAFTGIDALSHAVEAYVCVRANPISDAIAEKAIELVGQNLRAAYADGSDLQARGQMLVASAMAVIAASNAGGLGVIHSLAQTLGGYYNLPHGLTIAVSFPYGLGYNLEAVPEKYARVAALLGVDTSGMDTQEAAAAVIPAVEQLAADVGIDDDMLSLGVRQEDISSLAEYAVLDGCTPTNPRPIDAAGFVRLYEEALAESTPTLA